jgi:hypothetical protein
MRRRAGPWGRGLGRGGRGLGFGPRREPGSPPLECAGAWRLPVSPWSGKVSGGAASATRGNCRRGEARVKSREPRLTAAVRSPGVRRPSFEVAPPLTPRLWAAGPRPSARASSGAGRHRPLFPAGPARALGPLQGPAHGGRGRPPAGPEPPGRTPPGRCSAPRGPPAPRPASWPQPRRSSRRRPLGRPRSPAWRPSWVSTPTLVTSFPPHLPFIHPSLLQCLRSRPERKGPRPRRTKPKGSESCTPSSRSLDFLGRLLCSSFVP